MSQVQKYDPTPCNLRPSSLLKQTTTDVHIKNVYSFGFPLSTVRFSGACGCPARHFTEKSTDENVSPPLIIWEPGCGRNAYKYISRLSPFRSGPVTDYKKRAVAIKRCRQRDNLKGCLYILAFSCKSTQLFSFSFQLTALTTRYNLAHN